jgi:hypothetical protein
MDAFFGGFNKSTMTHRDALSGEGIHSITFG